MFCPVCGSQNVQEANHKFKHLHCHGLEKKGSNGAQVIVLLKAYVCQDEQKVFFISIPEGEEETLDPLSMFVPISDSDSETWED